MIKTEADITMEYFKCPSDDGLLGTGRNTLDSKGVTGTRRHRGIQPPPLLHRLHIENYKTL